jgi:hypothetical protein
MTRQLRYIWSSLYSPTSTRHKSRPSRTSNHARFGLDRQYYKQYNRHKTKIEHLVQESLDYGIISQTKSMYSAPIILVRTKDGSYILFNNNCCESNEITIKDKFPISFVDELLDELHGSEHFLKLDQKFNYHIRV